MRKNFALLILSIFVLVGCTKKEIVMDQTEVTLHPGETYQIAAESSSPITYLSEDRFHAEVNVDGVVTAKYVGETNIKLSNGKDEKKLHVIVTPTNFCITEPDVAFGDSKASILEKFGEPDMEETESGYTALMYAYSDYAMLMVFVLDENDNVVATLLGGMANITNDMKEFLGERYLYEGPFELEGEEGDAYINALTENEATIKIAHLVVEDQLSIAVYSTPEYLNNGGYIGLKNSSKFSHLVRK